MQKSVRRSIVKRGPIGRNTARTKQRGSLLFDILVGAGVLAAIFVSAIVVVNQRAAASEETRAFAIIAEQVPAALTSVYYDNRRSYESVTDADRVEAIVERGVPDVMPWGDPWSVETAGTVGPAPTASFNFPCTNARDAAAMCTNLEERVQQVIDDSPNGSTLLVVTDNGTDLTVQYGRPR